MRYLVLVVFCSWLGGCAVNPVTGERELTFVSESQEISIGQQNYSPSKQSQGGDYTVDPALTAYVSQVGQRVAAQSDRDLPYEFAVLNNGVPNAWALPGGKIAINRGLLTELENEAELAAVLGHEVVHSAARHGAKSMERGTLLQGVLMATAIGASQTEYGNFIVGGAQVGAQLISTKYGRDAELESDFYGTRYMVAAGYDPEGAVTLQEKFVALSAGRESSWLEGLFASHPPSEERVRRNVETARTLKQETAADLDLGKKRFQQKMAYLNASQPAYDAFTEAHGHAAGGDMTKALASVNKAIKLEPKEPRFYGLRGDIYLEQNKFQAATEEYSKALNRDKNYYEYYLGRGLANKQMGNAAAAKRDLELSADLLPTSIAMNELGELSLAAGQPQVAKGYFKNAMDAGGNQGQRALVAYTKLDLPGNPAPYFQSRATLDGGQIKAQVGNASAVDVKRINVTFTAIINGQTVSKTVRGGALSTGKAYVLNSGIAVDAQDQLGDVSVQVTAATL